MIWKIAKKELMSIWRSRAFVVSYIILICLISISAITGDKTFKQQHHERKHAENETRQQWVNQDSKHPHMAAHFGNFAFMPKTALSMFDVGVDAFIGTTIYLEPHVQNNFAFKPAEARNASLRFGELSMAMTLQVLLPILIIFISFSAFSGERKSGTLKQLYAHGLSFKQLYWGKFIGYSIVAFSMLLPAIVLLFAAQLLLNPSLETFQRIGLLTLFYAFYLLLFVGIALLVSAFCKESKSAVLILLAIWVANVILIPKWAANVGDNQYPLPTKHEFSKAISADISKGIDGHNTSNERAQKVEKELLKKYNVDTISKLPFNFEGYIMQAGEEYSSKVYDKHFSTLQNTLKKQNQISLFASIIDPFIAIKSISMSLSGTDYYTHLDFQKQAENYRRSFVQFMNKDMQDHSELGDWDYQINKNTYDETPKFTYAKPSIMDSIKPYLTGFASLIIWSLIILISVAVFNSKSMINKV